MSASSHRTALKFHPRRRLPLHRLPFVGNEFTQGERLSFWDVPASGGYTGGTVTGAALADIYLKFLRSGEAGPGGLAMIVSAWLERLAPGMGRDESEPLASLLGQVVGFVEALAPWLALGAQHQAGGALDAIGDAELLRRANEGLSLDERSYVTQLVEKHDACTANS